MAQAEGLARAQQAGRPALAAGALVRMDAALVCKERRGRGPEQVNKWEEISPATLSYEISGNG
jgi:hypothetical protein